MLLITEPHQAHALSSSGGASGVPRAADDDNVVRATNLQHTHANLRILFKLCKLRPISITRANRCDHPRLSCHLCLLDPPAQ